VLFDIGVGLLLTALVGVITGSEPTWTLVMVGLAGSLWPDIDFLIWILRGKKIDHFAHQHRDLLHKPLMLTPLLTIFVVTYLGWRAGIIAGAATLVHFLHDSGSTGWGVKWFWPLNDLYYAYRACGNEPARLHKWTRVEQDQLCRCYGDSQWMKNMYGRLTSPTMIVDFCVLAGGVRAIIVWYVFYHFVIKFFA
jgi:hypothetical protein